MSHSGKHLKVRFALLLLVLFAGVTTPARANPRFYSTVQQICTTYRVNTNSSQMNLEETSEGSYAFTLRLESRRNNFEEVMMVGYIAAGEAVGRTNLNVQTIHIIVTIPGADNMLLMTTADIALVKQLLQGEIRSYDFIRQLQWN